MTEKGLYVQLVIEVVAYLSVLFWVCMVCHGELARSKPEPQRLTSFYLMTAGGGALGGVVCRRSLPLVVHDPLGDEPLPGDRGGAELGRAATRGTPPVAGGLMETPADRRTGRRRGTDLCRYHSARRPRPWRIRLDPKLLRCTPRRP